MNIQTTTDGYRSKFLLIGGLNLLLFVIYVFNYRTASISIRDTAMQNSHALNYLFSHFAILIAFSILFKVVNMLTKQNNVWARIFFDTAIIIFAAGFICLLTGIISVTGLFA